jgi:hypothetical protein
MHFRFEHTFDTDPKTFWEIFFDDGYTNEMYRRVGMREHKIVEQKDDGRTLKRIVHLTPAQEVPAVFKSVIKDTGYTEHDLFHRERSAMEIVIEPGMMKNKFDFKGTYSVVDAGNGRCRRVFEGDCKVSVMIIGGQIEKFIVDQMRHSYEVAADVTKEWIARRKSQA